MKNGLSKPQADFIFDLLAKFADYGFNKSHAAAYAVVSYQTAYLKAHYPVEFLAASMTLDMGNTDKLADFRQDALRLGIDVVPPSVKTSFRDFEVGENRIFYSLAALKGVGDAAVEHIVAKRQEKPFASLEDFCERVDPKIVGKRVLETLIMAGALDCFGHDRAAMMAGDRAHDGPGVPRLRGCRARHHRHVRRLGCPASRSCICRSPSHGCRPTGCTASSRWSASTSPRIRSTNTAPR